MKQLRVLNKVRASTLSTPRLKPTTLSSTHLLLLRCRRCVQIQDRDIGLASITSAILAAQSHAYRVSRITIGSIGKTSSQQYRPPLGALSWSNTVLAGSLSSTVRCRYNSFPAIRLPLHCGRILIVALDNTIPLSLPQPIITPLLILHLRAPAYSWRIVQISK
jgi:hypothetical protein